MAQTSRTSRTKARTSRTNARKQATAIKQLRASKQLQASSCEQKWLREVNKSCIDTRDIRDIRDMLRGLRLLLLLQLLCPHPTNMALLLAMFLKFVAVPQIAQFAILCLRVRCCCCRCWCWCRCTCCCWWCCQNGPNMALRWPQIYCIIGAIIIRQS